MNAKCIQFFLEVIFIATVGIWKVTSNLKSVVNYTTNEEKTKMESEFIDAMDELLNYVDDEKKNEDHLYITGVNCEPKTAIEEMLETKQIWNKEDGILGFHAYQSFAKDTVTPDEVHKIGVELASEMWGDRFQVVVSTHLNTEHYHNHFVVNSVSFVDGKKYYDNRKNYAELRRLNDEICLEHGLDVLEEKTTRRHINYQNYLDDGTGEKVTYYSITRKDIVLAIKEATSYQEFLGLLQNMNYTVTNRYGKLSVRRNNYKKNIRIERYFGEDYSIENIKTRILNEVVQDKVKVSTNYNQNKSKTKRYKGIVGLYKYYCYLLGIYPKNVRNQKLPPSMRLDLYNMDSISNEARLLAEKNIENIGQLCDLKLELKDKITKLTNEKEKLWYRYRTSSNETHKEIIKKRISDISVELKPIRNDLKLVENIERRKDRIRENLKEFEKREEVNRESIK